MRWRPNIVRSLGWDPRQHEEVRNGPEARCVSELFWKNSAVLYFRKVVLEIFSELDKTKTEVLIFLSRRRSQKGRRRKAGSGPHHTLARAHPRPRLGMVWAHQAPALDGFWETLTLFPHYIKRGGLAGHSCSVRNPNLPPLLPPSFSCSGLGEALQEFSSTTTTPSCCWDSEGIYHTSAARWNGERTGFIDTVRATEYGSAAGLQHWG
jgi:hypothetical protein